MIQMHPEILQKLTAVVGSSYVFIDQETRNHYGHDETENFVFPPSVVVKPANADEISAVLKIANEYKIPTTPIGARTGLSGGALCIYEGIGLSFE